MPIAIVIGRADALPLALSELLLAKACRVYLYTKEKREAEKKLVHLSQNRNLVILGSGEPLPLKADYLFFVDEVPSDAFLQKFPSAKALVILPYLAKREKSPFDFKSPKVRVVYVGEVFGPRMLFDKETPVVKILKSVALGGSLEAFQNDTRVFPVFAGDAAREIIRIMFSYGRDGAVLGREIALSELVREETFGATLSWFKKNQFRPANPRTFPKLKIRTRSSLVFAGAILLIWFLGLPFISLFASSVILKNAYEAIRAGNLGGAATNLNIATSLSLFGKTNLGLISSVPLVGRAFVFADEAADLLVEASQAGKKTLVIYELTSELVSRILGDKDYDLPALSSRLSLELGDVYQSVSLLETKAVWLPLGRETLSEAKSLLLAAKAISTKLPSLLGSSKQNIYLVLFQNNMELRPTGGFIGSFGLATFDKGRLTDFSVYDVYSADGQLKGHVEPPVPIRRYLGEANWFLRDSNWDPDFAVSAERAEWFLEKELDRTVDGVIGVDLELAKNLLAQIGPVKVIDFDEEVTSDNLYEKTQYLVEEEFFPGSRKKANFLTALASTLLTEIRGLPQNQYPKMALAFFSAGKGRHLQVFLEEKDAQRGVLDAGLGGEALPYECTGNCEGNWLGLAEANLGVNKANYFVKRKLTLTSTVSEKEVRNALTVELTNTASPALGPTYRYKAYVRLLAPREAKIDKATIIEPGQEIATLPEMTSVAGRQEAGVLIEIQPGQAKKIIYEWTKPASLNFQSTGRVILSVRKQAGTSGDPIDITATLPSLTKRKEVRYNTTLAKDLILPIFW